MKYKRVINKGQYRHGRCCRFEQTKDKEARRTCYRWIITENRSIHNNSRTSDCPKTSFNWPPACMYSPYSTSRKKTKQESICDNSSAIWKASQENVLWKMDARVDYTTTFCFNTKTKHRGSVPFFICQLHVCLYVRIYMAIATHIIVFEPKDINILPGKTWQNHLKGEGAQHSSELETTEASSGFDDRKRREHQAAAVSSCSTPLVPSTATFRQQ